MTTSDGTSCPTSDGWAPAVSLLPPAGLVSYSFSVPPLGMDISTADREYLSTIISIALTMVPMRVAKAFGEKPTATRDPAKAEITEAVVVAVVEGFALRRRPGPRMETRLQQPLPPRE